MPSGIIRSMQRDYLGNPVTGDNDGTLRAINDFIEGFLAYETRAERILEAASADPQSCIANAYAGFLWMLLEAPEAPEKAAQFVAAAERAAVHANRREQLNVAILEAWVAEDVPRPMCPTCMAWRPSRTSSAIYWMKPNRRRAPRCPCAARSPGRSMRWPMSC